MKNKAAAIYAVIRRKDSGFCSFTCTYGIQSAGRFQYINEYVARVKELGMNSAAITDHGVMFGCIDFYKAAKAAGIKPIMGCEVYVAPGSRFDKETGHF